MRSARTFFATRAAPIALGIVLLTAPQSRAHAQATAATPRVAAALYEPARYAIIPRPVLLEPRTGEFTLTAKTFITVSPRDSMLAHQLARELAPSTGYALRIRVSNTPAAVGRTIVLLRGGTCQRF